MSSVGDTSPASKSLDAVIPFSKVTNAKNPSFKDALPELDKSNKEKSLSPKSNSLSSLVTVLDVIKKECLTTNLLVKRHRSSGELMYTVKKSAETVIDGSMSDDESPSFRERIHAHSVFGEYLPNLEVAGKNAARSPSSSVESTDNEKEDEDSEKEEKSKELVKKTEEKVLISLPGDKKKKKKSGDVRKRREKRRKYRMRKKKRQQEAKMKLAADSGKSGGSDKGSSAKKEEKSAKKEEPSKNLSVSIPSSSPKSNTSSDCFKTLVLLQKIEKTKNSKQVSPFPMTTKNSTQSSPVKESHSQSLKTAAKEIQFAFLSPNKEREVKEGDALLKTPKTDASNKSDNSVMTPASDASLQSAKTVVKTALPDADLLPFIEFIYTQEAFLREVELLTGSKQPVLPPISGNASRESGQKSTFKLPPPFKAIKSEKELKDRQEVLGKREEAVIEHVKSSNSNPPSNIDALKSSSLEQLIKNTAGGEKNVSASLVEEVRGVGRPAGEGSSIFFYIAIALVILLLLLNKFFNFV